MAQKIMVMTDIHLRPPGQTIIGLDPAARFSACLDHALDRHGDADRLILTGDLTHSGHPSEYAVLADILRDVPLPISLMLGNHDRRDAFLAAFPDTPVTAQGHVQTLIDLPDARLILLDTLDGPPFRDGHHAGHLCPDRHAWLGAALTGAAGRQALVFAHHPAMAVGFPAMDSIRLTDGTALLSRLAAHDAPAHLIAGHIHRTISGTAQGVPFTIFKSPCHQMPMDLSSTDTSLSVDEPGAYGIILIGPGGIIVHSEDVGLPEHTPVAGYGDGQNAP